MAHNIEFNRNSATYSFFSRKEVAWHGLGQVVQDAQNSEQAIHLANLNYIVEKRPCYIRPNPHNELKVIEVPNTFALMRTDLEIVLNKSGKTVTNTYETIQNHEAFDFFDTIVGSKEAIFETAGVLGVGERIFITAKLPSVIRMVGSDDIIEKYLLLTSAHDGAGAVEAMLTPIRVVCNNTLNIALQHSSNKISIRHTKSARDKMSQAAKLMGLYKLYDIEFQELTSALAKIAIDDSKFNDIIGSLIFTDAELALWKRAEFKLFKVDEISTRKKNVFDDITQSVVSGVGQDFYRGSGLWMVNGISTYLNNTKEYKDPEKKFDHVLYGSGQKLLQKTLNLVMS